MAVSLSLAITQNSPSTANNTSNVTVKVNISWTYGSWNALGPSGWVKIDGTQYNFKSSFNTGRTQSGSQTLFTKTLDIAHNADGTKTLNCSAYFAADVTPKEVTASASKTLTTIERASQPSLITWPENTKNVGDFGTTISIHMNRKSDKFTHTVRYTFGSKSGTIATGVATGTTWTIPLSLMDSIPSSLSGSGTVYVDTYNGSTKIGTKSCSFTATVPASVKPTCTFTLDDITGVDNTYGSPVKGLSRIKVTVTAKTAYSSPIDSYSVTANGVKYSGQTITTDILQTAGTSKVTVTVKDKRGRSGTSSYDMTVLNYTAPVVSALTVHRCDEDGTTNDRGDYVKATFSAAVSSLSSKNSASYVLKYKKTSATTWSSVTLSALANKYSVSNHEHILKADGNSAYDISVTVTDKHRSTSRSTSASTAFTLVNYHADGNAISFGGVATEADTFQNYLAFHQTGNTYAFQPGAFNGEKGYTCLAQITLTELNVNAPIVFKLNRRGAVSPMNVYIRFASSSTTTDPDLASIVYEGDNYGAFLVKTATSTWKLYVDNTGGWSNPCVQDWFTTDNQAARLAVTFPTEQIAALPNPYYRATPVISRSILDAFYPVGYILLLYSHADPNEMYPGTTWVRIYGAFPWFTDANGQIGLTGGERNVTLTVGQLPSHSHGSVYSGTADGTKNTAWLASGGDKMAYGALYAGGGEAHNNMPPYIQISAWRRTA